MTMQHPVSEPMRALVIDHDVGTANAACALLRLHGCKTAAAFGGLTGAKLADLFRPDLVFLAVDMPDLDVEGTLARIRQSGPDVVVIALSAHEQPAPQELGVLDEIDHVLPRPVLEAELDQLIRVLLRLRSMQAQMSGQEAHQRETRHGGR